MSLSSALVDRARVVEFTAVLAGDPPVPVKVEGETQMTWVYGEWFAARINSPEAAESPDSAGGRVRVDQHPTLIFDIEDEAGNAVRIDADDRVQVDSEALGVATFEVTGQPTLFRKKEDVIAGSVVVKRVLDFGVAGLPERGTATVGITAGQSGQTQGLGTTALVLDEAGSGAVV
jgi:hypothetical protein